MKAVDTASSWTYSTAAYRQSHANVANQLDMVIGLSEDLIFATSISKVSTTTASSVSCCTGIGLDSTTVNSAINGFSSTGLNSDSPTEIANWTGYSGAGRHLLVWLEFASGTPTQTWYGDNGGSIMQTGISGFILG
jgi:hypothetical protein